VLSNAQALYDVTIDEVLVNDFVNIVLIDIGIPNAFRVYDEGRSFIAAIETAGLIDPDASLPGNLELLDARFCIVAYCLRAMVVAARAAIVALIATEKNMMFKITQQVTPRRCGVTIIAERRLPQCQRKQTDQRGYLRTRSLCQRRR
jgi:hypothetical protein